MIEPTNRAERVQDAFRAAIAEGMDGLPVTVNRMSLNINPDATLEERRAMLEVILQSGQRANCELRFQMGDWWNSLGTAYGERKEILKGWFGDSPIFKRIYADCRDSGWVAGKWKSTQRMVKYPWSFFVKERPGCLHTDTDKKENTQTRAERLSRIIDSVPSQMTFDLEFSTGSTDPRVEAVELHDGIGQLTTKGGQTYFFHYDAGFKVSIPESEADDFAEREYSR